MESAKLIPVTMVVVVMEILNNKIVEDFTKVGRILPAFLVKSGINRDLKMNNRNNYCFWIGLIVYICITVVMLVNHQPWFDEAHAWTVAQELNILDIIYQAPLEGHTFLWYTLLMPFAKTNFFYPWSMFY